MAFRIYHGSILETGADVLVNAANTKLQHGGGVAAAIARAAGPALVTESRRIGFCPIGRAVATTAGNLDARAVVHIPTMDLEPWGRIATPNEIAESARIAMRMCREIGGRSIAFPLLGAGIAGRNPRDIALALKGVFDENQDLDILLCAYSAADRQAVADLEHG